MKTIKLGSSDFEIPVIAIGCMRMSRLDIPQAEELVREAVDMGAGYFDHADIYGGGKCEEIFGSVLRRNPGLREKIILQSKAGIVPGVMYDNSKEYILKAVDGILQRLQTEYLGVFSASQAGCPGRCPGYGGSTGKPVPLGKGQIFRSI